MNVGKGAPAVHLQQGHTEAIAKTKANALTEH